MAKVAILAVVATLWLHCSYTVRQRLTLDRMTRAQKKRQVVGPASFLFRNIVSEFLLTIFLESRYWITSDNLCIGHFSVKHKQKKTGCWPCLFSFIETSCPSSY